MNFPRSFFCALLVALALPALAADKKSSPPQPAVPAERQAALTRGPYAQQFLARAGLLSTEPETRIDLEHPFVFGSTMLNEIDPRSFHSLAQAEAQMANADGVCYTLRMYKVKPTERLAAGESPSRGYSTCELARNYQIRSLRVPEERAGAPKAQSQQK